MTERIYKGQSAEAKDHYAQEASKDAEVQENLGKQAVHDAHIEEIDALLDEIDAVLEENAEQFVRDYVQQGGE